MSLLDTASLLVTPNAYKEGKLYSVIPTNGNGDLTFTRATTATRVNSAGLVELVPYNLFERSEEFDNNGYWNKLGSTISANAIVAPNGTTTADKVIETSTTADHYVTRANIFTQGLTYTISVYAKAGERNWVALGFNNESQKVAWFNLTTGVVGTVLSNVTATSIESVGNGWYRCSATMTAATNLPYPSVMIAPSDGVKNYLGNGTNGLYIWGGQLVEGTNALTYQKTETRLNIPRLDYSLGGCPSLLVEPQRTNIIARSEEFNTWLLYQFSSIATNTATAPNGTLTADTLISGVSVGRQEVYKSPNSAFVNGTSYSVSVYAKTNGKTWLYLGTDANQAVYFNVVNGTVGNASSGFTGSIVSVGNGWYRCIINFVFGTGATVNQIIIGNATTNGTPSDSGNGVLGNYIWGAQIEAGAYATSYIPTISASVTRNQDLVSKTSASALIGQTEGTLFCEIKLQNLNSASTYVGMTSGTFANGILIGKEAGVIPNKLVFYIFASGSTVLNNTSIALSSSFVKCAIAYKSGNWSAYCNGSLVASGTSTFSFSAALDRFGFGSNAAFSVLDDEMEVKQTALWKTRLTNTELEQLTTI